MKKLLYIALGIGLLWLLALSYYHYSTAQQLSLIQENLHQTEQHNANLNDQMVALQRSIQTQSSNQKTSTLRRADTTTGQIAPTVLFKQKLELAQFALQQQQFLYALEQLNALDIMVERYDVADTLKASLHRAVAQDKKMIQQYVANKNTQLMQMGDLLELIDHSIQDEMKNEKLGWQPTAETSFWSRWFRVERVAQQSSELLNRRLILKEIQLRVLFAQRALIQGQWVDYQKMLALLQQELAQLPDAYSQQLKVKILNLQQTQALPVPKLSSMAILES